MYGCVVAVDSRAGSPPTGPVCFACYCLSLFLRYCFFWVLFGLFVSSPVCPSPIILPTLPLFTISHPLSIHLLGMNGSEYGVFTLLITLPLLIHYL